MTVAQVLLYDYPTSICSQMARLALVEKGVPFEGRTVDIMEKAEQFETWYTALNPKAVVPTLAIGAEIVTDTIRIVYRVDRDFDGPSLTPDDPDEVAAMDRMMRDVMALHYGVLMYSRRLDAAGKSPIVVARGSFLREQRSRYPERAEVLDSRIAGNDRLQAALSNPAEIARHVDRARTLVGRIDAALANAPFVSGQRYTLADTFATPALARFRVHGFDEWWSTGSNANVAAYYQRMRERSSWSAAGVVDFGSERDL
jgi:tetrachloro-p-hydroquinone reductive dehalogenase